jgi:hypothetical protein
MPASQSRAPIGPLFKMGAACSPSRTHTGATAANTQLAFSFFFPLFFAVCWRRREKSPSSLSLAPPCRACADPLLAIFDFLRTIQAWEPAGRGLAPPLRVPCVHAQLPTVAETSFRRAMRVSDHSIVDASGRLFHYCYCWPLCF